MVIQIPLSQTDAEIIYPDSDGQPMADNTIQFRWITLIQNNLDSFFTDSPEVFVAGDLLWYPVEGNNKLRQAPDVMVVFGVPKGDRGFYQQWKENNIAPQVVFEILSPGNTPKEMNRKLLFYDRYGVEEYYIYDPQKNTLKGWLRSEPSLEIIDEINGWVSPRLGIKFEVKKETLILYRPDGKLFINHSEMEKKLEVAEEQTLQERQAKEIAQKQVFEAQSRANVAEEKLLQERQAKEIAQQKLLQERQAKERLEKLLREAGIEPNSNK